MNKTARTNRLYNYLVNTYGLSKENILDHVSKRLDQIIGKHLKEVLKTSQIKKLILNNISSIILREVKTRYGGLEEFSFERYVKSAIVDIVKQFLEEEYDLDIKIVKKSTKE